MSVCIDRLKIINQLPILKCVYLTVFGSETKKKEVGLAKLCTIAGQNTGQRTRAKRPAKGPGPVRFGPQIAPAESVKSIVGLASERLNELAKRMRELAKRSSPK